MNELDWAEQYEIAVDDFSSFKVEKWSSQDANEPDALNLSFSVNWIAFAGMENEEVRHDCASTIYGMSADELEIAARRLAALAAKLKGDN